MPDLTGTGGSDDCTPKTCEELGKNCGSVADGCGNLLECGKCGSGELCGIVEANTCTDPASLCKPLTQAEACAGKECGIEGDGCDGSYDCGSCATGYACGSETPFQCSKILVDDPDNCPAKIDSCADVGLDCGVIGNGCGGTLDCTAESGGCTNGTFCGGGGPNQCGTDLPDCQPLDPAFACAGKCGTVSNGCGEEVNGGVIDCSSLFPCPSGEQCGAAGIPNECGAGSCTETSQTAACGNRECGAVSDGCDGSYSCGTCPAAEMCQGGSCVPICQPIAKATACGGKECGSVGDGCGGVYNCGTCDTGEQCGAKFAFTCDAIPPSVCVPRTKAEACGGKECGTVYDGCGSAAANAINCGSCGSGEFCGIQQAYQCDLPPTQQCTAGGSCAAMGWACGMAIDACGNVYNCANEGRSCGALQTCVGGINGPTQCVSDTGGGSCPLCTSVPNCSGQPQLTKLNGRVVTPGRSDTNTGNQVGVPNAFVYILRTNSVSDLPAITTGVPSGGSSCDRCADQDLGPVLASAMTDATGNYSLEGNIPVGQQFLLVVKAGKFRRAVQYTLPTSAACKTTTLPTALPGNPTRLPRTKTDGLAVNLPKIAVTTGEVDAMECVFEKLGVAQSEFTRPGGSGRVHLFRSNGAWPDSNAENCNDCGTGTTTTENTCRSTYCGGSALSNRTNLMNALDDARLYDANGSIWGYDMVVSDCEGDGWAHQNTYDATVRSYVNRGGRMFASHYSRHWICDNGSTGYSSGSPYATGLSSSAVWNDCNGDGTLVDSGTGIVSLGRPNTNTAKLQDFAAWLVNESAATLTGGLYQFNIIKPRDLAKSVGQWSEEFVYRDTGSSVMSVQQYSFNTPYGAPQNAVCGRVAYSGFHVTPSDDLSDSVFPSYCTGNLSAQEKVLLYMLFDLGACVGEEPEPPTCTPSACPAGACGLMPDGCGGYNQCTCAPGKACISNQCVDPNCTPTTCAAEGASCGIVANGCGGTLDCGTCPSCTPTPEAQACSGKCGFVSDGCGGVYECPDCTGGLACSLGACVPGSCKPLTECPANLDCGVISDNCSGSVNCGTCTLPEVCGGSGQSNVCGIPECKPLTCDEVGAACGLIGDGCGGTVDCGLCPLGQACGIGGTPNQCSGCEPRTCADANAECGIIGDGCGGVVQCGPCKDGLICGAQSPNQCGSGPSCEPQSCSDVGAECGIVGDGCGAQVDCGECPPGELCGLDSPFKCGKPPACVKQTCEAVGAQCGAIGDGCGGFVDCGPCPEGATCGLYQANKCDSLEVR